MHHITFSGPNITSHSQDQISHHILRTKQHIPIYGPRTSHSQDQESNHIFRLRPCITISGKGSNSHSQDQASHLSQRTNHQTASGQGIISHSQDQSSHSQDQAHPFSGPINTSQSKDQASISFKPRHHITYHILRTKHHIIF